VRIFFKSVNIWQSYKQERGCLMLFVRLASTSLKDEESARDSHVLACNFARYLLFWRTLYIRRNARSVSTVWGWTSGPAGRAVSSMHATAELLLL